MRFGERWWGHLGTFMISRPTYQGSDWWKFSICNRVMGANQSASSLRNLAGNSARNAVGNLVGNSAGNLAGDSVGILQESLQEILQEILWEIL